MQFGSWQYLPLLILVPILAGLYGYGFRRRREALAKFLALDLAPRLVAGANRRRQWAKALCVIGAGGVLVIALMQPQWGRRAEDAPRWGRDVIVLLDVSLSMLAEDAEPNRLGRAKTMIRALVDEIRKEGGHRLGLVAFAGRASLQSPLTLDYAFFLDRLEAAGPDSVPRKGSSIGGAIRQSLQRFGALDHDFTDLILVSDGEEHDSSALDAARLAAAEGVSLYAVAVGGADRGAPIPLPGADGQTDYLQHDGAEVRTRTRPALLVEIAGATGGSVSLNGDGALQRIYTQQIADKPRRQVAAATGERAAVQYHWFVVAALMLLALESLVRERARGQA